MRTLCLCALLAFALPVRASEPERLPIVFHVAASNEHHAQPEAFIARQIAAANATFAPLGIAFFDAGRVALDARHAQLTTRADRDALLAHAKAGAIHCMVVARLMDVDEIGRERRGVHWHAPDTLFPHLVILSTLAGSYVLAHELGHFFGNPTHSDLPGNLMSYLPGVEPPFLTSAQNRRVARSLRRMRKSGELP